jgi:hypothetical protein
MRAWVLGLLALLLAGCTAQMWNERLSTPEERAFAEGSIRAIQGGDIKRLAQIADPETMGDFSARVLNSIRVGVPDGPARLMTVSSNTMTADGATKTYKAFNYELGAGQRWAIVQILLRTDGSALLLSGFRVWPADRSPSAANNFGFEGKGVIHYLWIALMLAAAAISITAFVLILRTRGLRFKWLWAIGALFGVCSFQLNWTTGAWGIWPLSIQLLGASAVQNGPLMPWVLSVAVPVVAIIFLVRRALGPAPAAEEETETFE